MKYPQLVSMPSAVSDWLEEQLEARGIDAVVYTRYILSLLHSHTVDIIHPDEDLQFSYLTKEGKGSSSGRKRYGCSSSEWWRHVQADAEQIKRLAAVECLMSASDQNCEIESLVDELCEKLKQVKSASTSPSVRPSADSAAPDHHKITPQELAEKYYAAFPPLKPQSPCQKVSKSMPLVPKWRQTSPKKGIKKQGKGGYEQKLHTKVDNDTMKARLQPKQRLNCFARNKHSVARKSDNWDLGGIFGSPPTKKSLPSKSKTVEEETMDQCLVDVNSNVWTNEDDDEMNMYEDLPVDIKELLDSPAPQDDTVEMLNMANMRDDGKRRFIPYGTNIVSSIWSTDRDISQDNSFNLAVGRPDSNAMLDLKFSTITIDGQQPKPGDWFSSMVCENEPVLFENDRVKKSLFLDGFRSLPGDWCKVELEKECLEKERLLNHMTVSLMKLNHSKESSCFTEVVPRSQAIGQNRLFNPFSRTSSMFSFQSHHNLSCEKDKEDLLTSEKSHFKPIREKVESVTQKQYVDGATFLISSNLDQVEYKRSESGSMLLDTEFGQTKKYWEYKQENPEPGQSPQMEFVLKFSICQNDKACQTEEVCDVELENVKTVGVNNEESCCTCPNVYLVADDCPEHQRAESVSGEVVWKYEKMACEKCNNNNKWNWSGNNNRTDTAWENRNLRNIWNGGEVCETCLSAPITSEDGQPLPSAQHNTLLREDISQDGEQLLSDLTDLQKAYMEDLPSHELSCDITEMVVGTAVTKRRRSYAAEDQSSWSFASRLEEDCLIQMAALPTLRSVTL